MILHGLFNIEMPQVYEIKIKIDPFSVHSTITMPLAVIYPYSHLSDLGNVIKILSDDHLPTVELSTYGVLEGYTHIFSSSITLTQLENKEIKEMAQTRKGRKRARNEDKVD